MKKGLVVLLLLVNVLAVPVYSQKHMKKVVLKGYVTNADKKPVEGAVIMTDSKITNVVSDKNGVFSIKIKPSVKVITACSKSDGVGKVEYSGQTEVNIILDKKMPLPEGVTFNSEDDELVNIGYGSMKKKDLSTAASSIDARQNRYAAYTDIYQLIKGEFPGVQVSGHSILIRGITSINSSTEPLLVVDGVPVSTIDNISPRQVRSVSVLKGSEAAIYGSRGGNGVILIDLIK